MRRTLVVILGAVLLGTPALVPAQKTKSAAPEEKAESSARVIDLEIHKPLPPDQGEMNMVFGTGTILGVLLAQPSKNIVGIDRNGSKLLRFVDDKETDLTKARDGAPRFGQPSGIESFFLKISNDHHRCAFRVHAVSTPVEGARKVLVKASVVLQCGSEEKTEEQKDVSLKVSNQGGPTLKPNDKGIMIGKFTLRAEKGFSGGPTVTINSDKPDIKSVTFIDAKGKEIKSSKNGSSPGGFPKAQYLTYYGLRQPADQATIKITYFDKIEEVTVPIDLEVGVGF